MAKACGELVEPRHGGTEKCEEFISRRWTRINADATRFSVARASCPWYFKYMGYDVHITRKEDWSDPDGPLISEEEWRKVIEDDPELTLDTDSKCVMTDGEYVFATWNQQVGIFGFSNGEITSKNPYQTTIRKMVEIAQRLNANVQGDDGEKYPEHFEVIAKQKPNWWQRLFGPK